MMTFRWISLVALILATSACIQLQGSPPTSRYFLLEPMTEVDQIYSDSSLSISVEVVDFPDYLRRSQVVVQQRNNILHFSDSQRWATALEDNIVTVLRSNLELMLPDAVISIGPWQGSRTDDKRLQLSIRKFTGILGERSDVDIRWRITSIDGKRHSGPFVHQHPIDDSYEELIRALNLGLEELSKELAAVLVKPGA